MHVKLVVNAFPAASETFLFNLVTGLESRGVRVTVTTLAPSSSPELYKDRLDRWSGNLEIIPLSAGVMKRGRSTWGAMLAQPAAAGQALQQLGVRRGSNALLRAHYLGRGDPDVIHFAYSGTGIAYLDALELLRRRRAKVFVSCRGSAEKVKAITVDQRGEQLERLFRTVDRVHCVSKDMLESLLPYGLRRDQAFVNYPSIDVDAFRRRAPYDTAAKQVWEIASTGRLHFQKGYVFGLLALRQLKRLGRRFRYHVLGEGPDREMLTYVIAQLGLQDDVVLYGKVGLAEVQRVLHQADIFLLSSLYEGIANAALEAMALELPVVTTTAGGMNEVVEHGVNGMLVERFDPEAIAAALATLMDAGELRGAMGKRARATVERTFRLSNQIERFIDEYRNTLT